MLDRRIMGYLHARMNFCRGGRNLPGNVGNALDCGLNGRGEFVRLARNATDHITALQVKALSQVSARQNAFQPIGGYVQVARCLGNVAQEEEVGVAPENGE